MNLHRAHVEGANDGEYQEQRDEGKEEVAETCLDPRDG